MSKKKKRKEIEKVTKKDTLIISDRIDAYWKFSLSPSARILADSPIKIKKEKK